MKSINPIQTRYAGCHFRSRLEARWAVFFDALGLVWEYEPEGYETPDGWYLPDFLITLRRRKIYIEIKPEIVHVGMASSDVPKDPRWKYIATLNGGLYVAYGLPKLGRDNYADKFCEDGFPRSDLETGIYRIWPNGEHEGFHFFCECPRCWGIDLKPAGGLFEFIPDNESDTEDDYLSCPGKLISPCCQRQYQLGGLMYHGSVSKIMRSYDAARSARFEHGESG